MTDEEIEKALEICKSESLPCYECAYWNISTQGYNCRNALIRDVFDYINRLKEKIYQTEQKFAECEVGYQATLDLERRMRADDKEQIRKETAKDILQLVESVKSGENCMRYRNFDFYGVKS